MTRRPHLLLSLATAAINTIARLGERAVMAWPQATHGTGICATCKQGKCTKTTTKETDR